MKKLHDVATGSRVMVHDAIMSRLWVGCVKHINFCCLCASSYREEALSILTAMLIDQSGTQVLHL